MQGNRQRSTCIPDASINPTNSNERRYGEGAHSGHRLDRSEAASWGDEKSDRGRSLMGARMYPAGMARMASMTLRLWKFEGLDEPVSSGVPMQQVAILPAAVGTGWRTLPVIFQRECTPC